MLEVFFFIAVLFAVCAVPYLAYQFFMLFMHPDPAKRKAQEDKILDSL